jgi:hypothetical protein
LKVADEVPLHWFLDPVHLLQGFLDLVLANDADAGVPGCSDCVWTVGLGDGNDGDALSVATSFNSCLDPPSHLCHSIGEIREWHKAA